ncbi:MAG: hypothetical protein BWY85_01119 [Firmicutes bacterium ADurb.Bin506]|jgi:hypothetical protein|nr:MAG: hypothetical protein BWY85_01119 [Firmicutes bacterium ADurb.Bin506]
MDVESSIATWKAEIAAQSHLAVEELDELEDHLRDAMEGLRAAGLDEEEAFLVASRRMGSSSVLAGELAAADRDKTWVQLPVADDGAAQGSVRREIGLVALAALAAAALGKLPLLFGVSLRTAEGVTVYGLNLSLFVIPVLIACYYVARRLPKSLVAPIGAVIAVSAVAVNVYPFDTAGSTLLLTTLHLPMLLWLVLGLAYTSGEWRNVRAVWDFIRFTGEFFVYSVLIGLGGAVFMMLTTTFFAAVGLDIEDMLMEWVGLSGLLGVPIVAAYLVEKKRSLIENIAPILARIFIPIFLVMTVVFLGVSLTRLEMLAQDRNLLIMVDLLLALITGMILYDLSARDSAAPFTFVDLMSVLLMSAALAIDLLALGGIAARLSQFGLSPNRVAALGENILLLANLAGLVYHYLRFRQGTGSRRDILSWQVRCVPWYVVWLVSVVFILPLLYRFA